MKLTGFKDSSSVESELLTSSNLNNLQNLLPEISVDLKDRWERFEDKDTKWSKTDLENAIIRYRKFLYLAKRHPNINIAPTKDIDTIWHLHMLSPVAYYNDCMSYFGTIFDHDGGFGHKPSELDELKNVFSLTQKIWMEDFNEEYVVHDKFSTTNCWHDCQGRCWHACSSKKNEEAIH